KLVELKEDFSRRLPVSYRRIIQDFDTSLTLTKPCDDSLELNVVRGRSGQVLLPYYVRVQLEGFGETTLEPDDKQIFYSTGMFALGPSKTLSGDRTTFGVLYDFLGLAE